MSHKSPVSALLKFDSNILRKIVAYSGSLALFNLLSCGSRILSAKLCSPSGISHYRNKNEYGSTIVCSDWLLNCLQGLRALSLTIDCEQHHLSSSTLKSLFRLVSLELHGKKALNWSTEGDLETGSYWFLNFAELYPELKSLSIWDCGHMWWNISSPPNLPQTLTHLELRSGLSGEFPLDIDLLPRGLKILSASMCSEDQSTMLRWIQDFPELHTLCLYGVPDFILADEASSVVSKTLRRLNLPDLYKMEFSDGTSGLRSFLSRLPHLEELHIPHLPLVANDLEDYHQLLELTCPSYEEFVSTGAWPRPITAKLKYLCFAEMLIQDRWPNRFDGTPFPVLERLEDVAGNYDVLTWKLPPSLTELRFKLFGSSEHWTDHHDDRLRGIPRHVKRLASSYPFSPDGSNDLLTFLHLLFVRTSVQIMEFSDETYFRAKHWAHSICDSRHCPEQVTGMTCLSHAAMVGDLDDLHFALKLNKDPQRLSSLRQNEIHPDSMIWLSRHGLLTALENKTNEM